jgi:hypothetical protein
MSFVQDRRVGVGLVKSVESSSLLVLSGSRPILPPTRFPRRLVTGSFDQAQVYGNFSKIPLNAKRQDQNPNVLFLYADSNTRGPSPRIA